MIWQVALAYLVDLIVGDPSFLPHPVVIIGKGISVLENYHRKFFSNPKGLKIAGIMLTFLIVGSSYAATYLIIKVLSMFNSWLPFVMSVWLISTTIAGKSLKKAALELYELLMKRDLKEARKKVGWIVGRDTENLDEGEITRATVETVAENIVDGIVAPLFYAFIGGAPLAMAYRATNTLDSMVGYRNEKYQNYGWASARFDDLLNFIPARITAFLMVIAALIMRLPVKRIVKIIFRDAPQHPSPNSGYPESAMAGALGVQLGGLNSYGGITSFRAYMGDKLYSLSAEHIKKANRMVDLTGLLAVITGILLYLLVNSILY